MPKMVDAGQRREEIADAVLRLIARDGLQQVSLRTVATEAGLNIGSVRHYFEGQRDLMRFAMRTIVDRTSARLVRHRDALTERPPHSAEEALARRVAMLEELLPLDASRRAEAAVLVEFLIAARTDPTLDDLAAQAVENTRTLAVRVLEGMARGGAPAGRDLETESHRLAALLDGLTLRGVLQPELVTARHCREALRTHLAELAGPG